MSQATPRLQALDALRGIAALGVVLFHYIPYYNELYGHSFTPPSFLEFGRYGVHLFFMLSGFVIFMSLERTANARKFALARAFRLLPALWLAIIITFIGVHLMGPENRAVDLSTALINAVLMQGYFGLEHVDGAYWSLVIEITFYFWMAILFYHIKQWQTLRRIFFVWVMCCYARVLFASSLTPSWMFVTDNLFFARYTPLFISGIVIYKWYKNHHLAPIDRLLLVLAMGHALFAYHSPFNYFVIACYAVFILAIHGKLDRLANKVTLWLGSISYSLYLVHQNIGYGIMQQSYEVGLPGPFNVLLAIIVAFLLAILIHYTVEKPALTWFRHKRRQRMAVATSS